MANEGPPFSETVPGQEQLDEWLETPWGEPKSPEIEISLLGILFTAALGMLVGALISNKMLPRWMRWLAGVMLLAFGAGVLWLSATTANP